jgi:hypothetical protein
MREPVPSAACAVRQEIVGQIKQAMTEIFTIHLEEVTAAIDRDFSRHDQLRGRLDQAQHLEGLLFDRLRLHSEEHGC